MLYVWIPEGQLDDEDELIFNFRQHVDIYILQNQVSTCGLKATSNPGAKGGIQYRVLPGNSRLRNAVVCQYTLKDSGLSYLFIDIMYDYFKETV